MGFLHYLLGYKTGGDEDEQIFKLNKNYSQMQKINK